MSQRPDTKTPPVPLPDQAGTESQHLDMLEDSDPRGDEVLFVPGERARGMKEERVRAVDELMAEGDFDVTMSEDMREGDEMSGDEHSSGLQGGDPELERQDTISAGMPGERNEQEEREVDARNRRRAV